MAEEKEDIIERLEALRKRAPEAKAKPPTRPLEDALRRKRIARSVGLAVIFLFIASVSYAGYVFLVKPKEAEIEKQALSLEELKTKKISGIEAAFAGLPASYAVVKDELISNVKKAGTPREVEGVDHTKAADTAWRGYVTDSYNKIAETTPDVELRVGEEPFRGRETILQKIRQLSYSDLKNVLIKEVGIEYVPIRVKRSQAVGGLAEPGDTVNIYYKNTSGIFKLAKNAKVTALLRGSTSGSINLAENERKSDTGGGVEGYGTASSLGIGSTGATLSGSYEGSTGLKIRQTETTYTVNIVEIQKAAAASKLSKSYIEEVLSNYGLRLNTIERETNIGDLDIEYLVLFEVRDDEAPALVSRVLSDTDRANLFVTISKKSAWMEDVK